MAKKRTTSVAVLATIFVLAATAFVFIFMTASADLALPDQPDNLPSTFADGGRAFGRIWDILMLAGGIIFMVLLLVGGLQYLTSGGDDGTATKAKNLLRDAVIGLVIMVLAWPIGVAVLTQFGLHTGQLITIGGQSFSLPNATSTEGNLDTGIDLGTGNQSGSSGGGSGGSTQNPNNAVRQVIVSASPADAGESIAAQPLDEGGIQDNKIVGPTGATTFNLPPGRYRIRIGGVEAGIRTISPQDGSTLNWTFERIGAETSRAISFALFDNNNQPLPNAIIQIFKRTDNGEERIGSFESTNGRVNIDLPEGQTFIIKDSTGTTLAEQQIPNTDGFVIPVIFSGGVPL